MKEGYRCADCGAEFDTPYLSRHGGGDTGEDWNVCPLCRSDNYDDLYECEACGRRDTSDYNLITFGRCDACVIGATKEYNALIDALSDQSREILEAVFGTLALGVRA